MFHSHSRLTTGPHRPLADLSLIDTMAHHQHGTPGALLSRPGPPSRDRLPQACGPVYCTANNSTTHVPTSLHWGLAEVHTL
ncbi:uncharacterized protein B0I36DRAFT_313880 [Microdochium trichocladiopsis]|uniref:Uncharacterized protein n=1 Tax=Microdochium trichocladiopsis TaxID=1682393 RepID=A0A9P9BU86_9PEZI|nr:uncharacterized protein B0I36DRAFT_313880 [Microdochium trichocladiopsis]KAH7037361.1 hypothetical protein B0I36DRAFT_313880 [Microdochium trichocladiopsis]